MYNYIYHTCLNAKSPSLYRLIIIATDYYDCQTEEVIYTIIIINESFCRMAIHTCMGSPALVNKPGSDGRPRSSLLRAPG